MPSPSGLSIVTGSTASVVVDGRREVFQLAVHAQGDDGAIGEEGEAVGGVGHVRRKGGVSQGTLQSVVRSSLLSFGRSAPARSGVERSRADGRDDGRAEYRRRTTEKSTVACRGFP